jgi:hypothetical protein
MVDVIEVIEWHRKNTTGSSVDQALESVRTLIDKGVHGGTAVDMVKSALDRSARERNYRRDSNNATPIDLGNVPGLAWKLLGMDLPAAAVGEVGPYTDEDGEEHDVGYCFAFFEDLVSHHDLEAEDVESFFIHDGLSKMTTHASVITEQIGGGGESSAINPGGGEATIYGIKWGVAVDESFAYLHCSHRMEKGTEQRRILADPDRLLNLGILEGTELPDDGVGI